jgi:chromatin remodeling complex protein RSC6
MANMMTAKVTVDSDLAAIIGVNEATRAEITSKVWAYIKEHKLQDAAAKSFIVPDEKLGKVLGKDRINMMGLPKQINMHIVK